MASKFGRIYDNSGTYSLTGLVAYPSPFSTYRVYLQSADLNLGIAGTRPSAALRHLVESRANLENMKRDLTPDQAKILSTSEPSLGYVFASLVLNSILRLLIQTSIGQDLIRTVSKEVLL